MDWRVVVFWAVVLPLCSVGIFAVIVKMGEYISGL